MQNRTESSFILMFSGMNVNQRELTTHVEFEPNTYYAAFSAELEAPASAMWALAIHLRDASSVHLTKMLLKHCQSALEEWLEAIHFNRPDKVCLSVRTFCANWCYHFAFLFS